MNMVTIERHEKLDAYLRSNHANLIYKLHYQLYELHEMDQPIIVATSLILGSAGFMYLAILNPLQKTVPNGGESHKTASRLPKLWSWHP